MTDGAILADYIVYSTFANEEVKEFREVKVICFIAKYTKKAIGYNLLRPKGVITSLTTITSVHAKLQLFMYIYICTCTLNK